MSKKTVKKNKTWNKNIAMNCQNQSTETHWSLIKAVIPKYPSTPHQAETTWTLMSHQQVAVMRSKKNKTPHTPPVSSVKQLKVSCTSGLNPTDMIKYNDAHKYLLEKK